MGGAHGVDVAPFEGVHGGGHVVQADGPARVRVPLVAVDPVEHQTLAVEEHQAVFHLQPAKADIVGNCFRDAPIRSGDGQRHPVQLRTVMVPGADILKSEGLTAQVLALRGQLQGTVEQRSLNGVV